MILLQTRQKSAGVLPARQGFLTQYAAKFAEKTCAYAYEDRFLHQIVDLGLNSVQLVKSDVIIIKGRRLLHAVL